MVPKVQLLRFVTRFPTLGWKTTQAVFYSWYRFNDFWFVDTPERGGNPDFYIPPNICEEEPGAPHGSVETQSTPHSEMLESKDQVLIRHQVVEESDRDTRLERKYQ